MSVFNDLLSLFFPQLCAGCGIPLVKGEDILCLNCLADLPKNNFTDGKENSFALTFLGRINYCYAISYYNFDKGGRVQHLLHQLKYKGRKDIGYKLGLMFGIELIQNPQFREIDTIIPVPLHPRKQRARGYNQSVEICRGISESMNRPVISGNLIRKVHTSSQTMKGRYERWKNVSGIFRVKNSNTLSGKHLLIVDDVVTTGATMEACCQPLLEIPGVKVSIAALASV
jgi:ComF family protein